MAEPLAYEGTGYEVVEEEPPELLARNLVAPGYLLAGATAFFFVGFLFAYFYLRALDNAGMWRPTGVDASVDAGETADRRGATRRARCWFGSVSATMARERHDRWRLAGLAALARGIAGLVLQVVAWTHEGFGPADGGLRERLRRLDGLIVLFVLGTMLWLEMTARDVVPVPQDPERAPAARRGVRRSASRWRTTSATRSRSSSPSSSGLSFYWTFLAAIAVVTWIVLYLDLKWTRCLSSWCRSGWRRSYALGAAEGGCASGAR